MTLRELYYILSLQQDGSSVSVPVTVCFMRYSESLCIFGSYDLRQESPHWKNRMSREGILYTVAHLGVDLAKEILFVP